MAIAMGVVVVAGIAIACSDKGAESGIELIVEVEACLKRIETLWLVGGVALKGLYVIEAEVAADTKTWGKAEILADAVEKCSGEFLVESHIVGADTDDIVC